MKRAYLGVALRDGLDVLLPEGSDVLPFLLRRAERMNAVCFWAVIDQAIAAAIVAELDEGNARNALILLQTLAFELGPVVADRDAIAACHKQASGRDSSDDDLKFTSAA